jgi:hypothetical protein
MHLRATLKQHFRRRAEVEASFGTLAIDSAFVVIPTL